MFHPTNWESRGSNYKASESFTTFKIYSMCYDNKPVNTKERKFYSKIPLGVGDAAREK